jgi:hypothetical protein
MTNYVNSPPSSEATADDGAQPAAQPVKLHSSSGGPRRLN